MTYLATSLKLAKFSVTERTAGFVTKWLSGIVESAAAARLEGAVAAAYAHEREHFAYGRWSLHIGTMSHHRSGRPTVVCPSVSGDGWPERVLSPPLSFAWRSDRSLADLMVVRPAGRSIWFECRPTAWIEGVGKTYWQFTFIPGVEPLGTQHERTDGEWGSGHYCVMLFLEIVWKCFILCLRSVANSWWPSVRL